MNASNPTFGEDLKPLPGIPSFVLKVMAVLFVHLVFLAVLLMQGCTQTTSGESADVTAAAR
jgi:hypothetical protein